MKKRLGLSILFILCTILMPIKASAATGTIFGASDSNLTKTTENGQTIQIKNQQSNTKIYLGANVTSGTLTEYKATIKLSNSNFIYKSFTKESGWSGTITPSEDGQSIFVDLKNTSGITGKKLVATISLVVSDAAASTETCSITLSKTEEPASTPKCQVVDGIYYDANGNEVSKEAYDASCTTQENPQTGNFLPYTLIVVGIAIAGGLYLVTKKNNKIYHV